MLRQYSHTHTHIRDLDRAVVAVVVVVVVVSWRALVSAHCNVLADGAQQAIWRYRWFLVAKRPQFRVRWLKLAKRWGLAEWWKWLFCIVYSFMEKMHHYHSWFFFFSFLSIYEVFYMDYSIYIHSWLSSLCVLCVELDYQHACHYVGCCLMIFSSLGIIDLINVVVNEIISSNRNEDWLGKNAHYRCPWAP